MEVDTNAEVESFLKDDGFITYVCTVAPEANSPWEAFFGQHSVHNSCAAQAKAILLAPIDIDCGLSQKDSADLKERVLTTLSHLAQ